jgi:enamine deaminase RidA (YjgF/YER057c/UK114 family)
VSAESRFAALKLELPPAPKAVGLYRPVVEVGGVVVVSGHGPGSGMLYLSGHGPLRPDGTLIKGRVGTDLDTAAGYQAARQTGLAMLATLRAHCVTFDRIARLVKTFGLVQCTPEFTDHPAVINGFSELMRDVFGEEHGIAARSAVGATSLPAGMAVEVEAIFALA